jgi:hypothetical protein
MTAAAHAVAAVPQSTLISIETTGAAQQWQVQVVTAHGVEHEMRLSADGARVISGPTTKHDDTVDRAKHQARVTAAKLDYVAATKVLNRAFPGARITELELDAQAHKTVWEADLSGSGGTELTVKIDAATGDVMSRATD